MIPVIQLARVRGSPLVYGEIHEKGAWTICNVVLIYHI